MMSFGTYYRRGLRVALIYVPGGMALERYSILEKLFAEGTKELLAELYLLIGPVLRALGPIFPVLLVAVAIVSITPEPAFANEAIKNAAEIAAKVRRKLDNRQDRTGGPADDEGAPAERTFTYEPSLKLKTLVRETTPGTLYQLRLESREHNLTELMERCTYNSDYQQHFCRVSLIVNGMRPANVFAFNGGAISEEPQFIHPKEHHPKDWLNTLELYVLMTDGASLQIKATKGFWTVPKVTLRVADVTAWWEEKKQKRLEAEQRRLEEQERQYQLEQARRLEEERLEAQRQREAQRQWELAEARRKADIQKDLAEALARERERKAKSLAKRQAFWAGVKSFFRRLFHLVIFATLISLSVLGLAFFKNRTAAHLEKAAEAERTAALSREREAKIVNDNLRNLSDKLEL